MSAYTELTRASYKASVRDVTTIFFTFAFPMIFLLVFGTIFRGQSVEGTGRSYIDYIAPGVLSWGVANAAVFGVAFTLMQWRDNDLLRLVRMSPTPLTTVLTSRFTVALAVALVQSVLFVIVALTPFFGLSLAGTWAQAGLVIALGTAVFFALGAIIGSLSNTAEGIAAISNFLMLPMAFLSGSFLPLAFMPDWLQNVSRALPLRYLNDGVANAFTGRGDGADLLLNCGVLVAFGVVFSLIAMKIFRWSNDT
jgi:ABC-2 type transport system permease protein